MVSEKIFLRFSHYMSMEANDPWGMANLDPRDLIGWIYVRDHLTLLHTKCTCISCGPHVFREDLSFSHYKSMGVNDPWGMANLDPRGMICRIYVGDH